MISECREYLVNKLKDVGIKNKVLTSLKLLNMSQDSHVGGVLFEKDEFEINNNKAIYTDEQGNKKKRRKKFDRKTSFSVVIGEYSDVKCEEIFDNFLNSLDDGLYIDSNYVQIVPQKAVWFDEKDSILKSKISVQILIEFDGGIYKDSGFKKITDIGVEADIDKEG